jgi:hypothetical protein
MAESPTRHSFFSITVSLTKGKSKWKREKGKGSFAKERAGG